MPAEQPTQSSANNRRDEPIAVLIPFDDCHCFVFTEKTVRCDEMLSPHRHFFAGLCLNIANPGRGTESIYYHNRGTFFRVVDDFEEGLTPQASAAASVGQEQAPFSE